MAPPCRIRKYRFTREAQAASALNHPNIVTVHDIDTTGDGEFIVMEFVDGMPLSELMRAGALSLDRALEYAVQMADALAASHAANIVHRDLKPANVMVTREGRVKVLDFGLSKWMIDANATADKATETAAPRTEAGAILGTVGYMSPEQALGQPVDARSDVFSFGIVLYEILAGRRPFRGDSDWATIDALIHQAPAPLADIRRDIPPSAAQIVQRCLEKDRAMRYPSAVELLTDLRALTPKTTSAHPARTRYAVLAGTAVLLVVTAIGWVAVRRWQSATLVGQAVPEIDRLVDAGQYMAAYRVGMRAERVAPGDPRIKEHLSRATLPMTLAEPAGATVSFKGFSDGAEGWQSLGRVPLKDVLVPIGQLQWKLEKDGFESSEGSSPMTPVITLRPIGEAPPAMVYVRGGLWREGTAVATLPDFWMDRYELTNREFKRFVDAGGYLNQKVLERAA